MSTIRALLAIAFFMAGAAFAREARANAPLWGLAVSPAPSAIASLPAPEPVPVPVSVRAAAVAANAGEPAALCRNAIARAEQTYGVPDQLLFAIGRIESGRPDPDSGSLSPWPWTINVEGVGHIYQTKPEVIAAVQDFQARGMRSIDVGCLQVNLLHHPDAFASLDQAFDPETNAQYGARFLQQLFQQTGSWPRATGAYHSMTPELGADYLHKVLAQWAIPDRPQGASRRAPPVVQAAMNVAQPNVAQPTAAQRLAGIGPAAPATIPAAPLSPAPLGGIGRILRTPGQAPAGAAGFARGLDAYRAAPVMLTGSLLRQASR